MGRAGKALLLRNGYLDFELICFHLGLAQSYWLYRVSLSYHNLLSFYKNYNFDLPVAKSLGFGLAYRRNLVSMSKQRVRIFDTTLRDGEQSPGCSMNLNEKVRMATKLQALGVDIIEAGFPIASEGDFAAVKAVSTSCRKVTVAALCRTAEQDVARAAEALAGAAHPRIHTFVATSDIHLEHKLKKSRREVLAMTRDAVRQACSYADEVEFSAEDATRSDPQYLFEVLDTAVEAGAKVLNVPDTVGYTTPTEFAALIELVKTRVVR